MTLVKICGITSLEDALASIDAGADALGFNFYRRSPRYVRPVDVLRIIEQLPSNILTIGVFVNERSPVLVEELVREAGVSAVQLHGDESPEYCKGLKGRTVIKVFRVTENFDPQQVRQFDVDAIMLDAFHDRLRGGTGKVFDWTVAAEVKRFVPNLFLAGGLSPENVGAAISAVRPYAVDACSSLETGPGKKSAERVKAFVRAVREA